MVGEVQQFPGTTCTFYLPFSVCMVARYKTKKIIIPPKYIILIYVFFQIILVIVDSVLLDILKLRHKVPGVLIVDAGFSGCRFDG